MDHFGPGRSVEMLRCLFVEHDDEHKFSGPPEVIDSSPLTKPLRCWTPNFDQSKDGVDYFSLSPPPST